MFSEISIRPALALLALAALTACGGGGDDAPPFTPSAELLATKKTNYNGALLRDNEQAFPSQGCRTLTLPTTVFEQTHTVTYAAAGVPEIDQARVAQAAEEAVKSLRELGSFTGVATGYTGEKVRVCVDTNQGAGGRGSGSAGYNTIFVAQDAHSIQQLVYHELVHTAQFAILGCIIGGINHYDGTSWSWIPAGERWLFEGMALRLAGQDGASSSSVRGAFSGTTPTPVDVIDNTTYPVLAQYPGYRLAVDTAVAKFANNNPASLWTFLRDYEARRDATINASTQCKRYDSAAWEASFQHVFGVPLRSGSTSFKSRFWELAATVR